MRYVEGTDLGTLLESEGPLETARTLSIAAQVASALDAAHARGLVHRDVKPRNILIAAGAGGEDPDHVYVCDFGLTKHTSDQARLTESGELLGTLDYVAPEQIESELVDGRTDVYSLGCVLYECLTGEAPFARDSKMAVLWSHLQEAPPAVTRLRPNLPAGLDAVVARAMAKSPAERYPTCRELVAAARATLGPSDEPEATAPLGALGRRRRQLAVLAGSIVLAAAAGTGAALLTGGEKKASTAPATPIQPVAPVAAASAAPTRGGQAAPPAPPAAIPAKTLARIDLETNAVVATVALGDTPSGVAVGEGAVWVAMRDDSVVLKIDPRTSTVEKTLRVAGAPGSITVGGEPAAVWVANGPAGVVEIRPTVGDTATAFDSGGAYTTSVGVWDGSIWAASPHDDFVARIDRRTGKVVERIDVSGWPFWIAVGGGAVWAGNLDGTVVRIDPATNEITETVKVRVAPVVMGGAPAVAFAGGSLWVTSFEDDAVLRIDPKTGKIVATYDVGGWPFWLAVREGSLWVTNFTDKTVMRFDTKTGEVLATIPVESGVSIVAAGPEGVWVVDGAVFGEGST